MSMEIEYNEAEATWHHGGAFETVLVHDASPGKNGSTYFITADNVYTSDEDYNLTYGEHDVLTCERCEDEA